VNILFYNLYLGFSVTIFISDGLCSTEKPGESS